MSWISTTFGANASTVFTPLGYCFGWLPGLVSLHLISDALIALAYYSIPLTLLCFAARRPLGRYNWVVGLFAGFIVACGTTHLLGIVTLWEPVFWLEGWFKAATAAISLVTALMLWPLLPKVLALPAPAEMQAANARLREEVAVRGRAEAELRGLQARLEELVRERTADLEQARDQLQREVGERIRMDRYKDELLSIVSHELRTPLTSIAGSLHMLTGEPSISADERKELGEIALRNTQRMIRLVNTLLDIDRIESGRTEFATAPISLAALTRTAVQDNRSYAELHGVQLEPAEPMAGSLVRGDADRLLQVLTNLISNAVKHAPRGSTVRLAVLEEGGNVRVTVTDRGPGIPREMQDRIFDKFVQVQRHADAGPEGFGLGLSIARAIVLRHGGHIGVISTEQGDTTFHFDLPALPSRSDAQYAHASAADIPTV